MRLEKSDRRLLLWAGLILVPLIAALAILSSNESDSGIPSSYSAQASGAKAAFLLLQDLGYEVERWEQPPTELPADASKTILVLANPTTPPSAEEKAALQTYLLRGGKILLTGPSARFYVSQADVVPEFVPEPIAKTFEPQLVTALTRGGAIKMSPLAYWKQSSTEVLAHYADASRPIVVSLSVTKGKVIWWAASTPLSNSGISKSGNLDLLLNSLGSAQDNRILWDEYFHSSRRTVMSYWSETPIFFALVQAGLVAVALLLTYSRRNGPIYPPDEQVRLSPLEFVETLGGLYRRAHATRVALEVPYARFRMMAARQLGMKADTPTAELARALRNRLGYKDDNLLDLLQRIEEALSDPGLQESTALELVQELNVHVHQLQLISFEK